MKIPKAGFSYTPKQVCSLCVHVTWHYTLGLRGRQTTRDLAITRRAAPCILNHWVMVNILYYRGISCNSLLRRLLSTTFHFVECYKLCMAFSLCWSKWRIKIVWFHDRLRLYQFSVLLYVDYYQYTYLRKNWHLRTYTLQKLIKFFFNELKGKPSLRFTLALISYHKFFPDFSYYHTQSHWETFKIITYKFNIQNFPILIKLKLVEILDKTSLQRYYLIIILLSLC